MEKISNIVQLLSFLLFYLILLIMTNDIHRHFSTPLKSPLFFRIISLPQIPYPQLQVSSPSPPIFYSYKRKYTFY